jgi:hypothetical protein
MALPVKTLIAAATMLAKDERAQRVARSLWDKGREAWGKRQSDRTAPADRPASSTSGTSRETYPAAQAGWRPGGDRPMRFGDGQSGDLIRFTYTDEHGLTCQRTVGNWRCEGGQLTGYCLNRKQDESFAVDRIGDWEEFPVQAGG